MESDDLTHTQLVRLVKERIATVAFTGRPLTPETSLALSRAGLDVTVTSEFKDTDKLRSLLLLPHDQRLPAVPNGPLLVAAVDDTTVGIFKKSELLASPDHALRSAALHDLGQLADTGAFGPHLTEALQSVLQDTQHAVLADDVAANLARCIESDFRTNLLGLHQAMILALGDSADEFARRLLRPSTEGLDSIALRFPKPGAMREGLLEFVEASTHQSLSDALRAYGDALGHTALVSDFSAAEVVDRWVSARSESSLDDVLQWGTSNSSPAYLYHLLSIALRDFPDLSPDVRSAIWEVVAAGLGADDKTPSSDVTQSRDLRCTLVRYYALFLECEYSFADPEIMANLAWWMADKVGDLFDTTPTRRAAFMNGPMKMESRIMNQLWMTTRQGQPAHPLRYANLHLESVHKEAALSLLCSIRLPASAPPSIEKLATSWREKALEIPLVRDGHAATYALELPLGSAAAPHRPLESHILTRLVSECGRDASNTAPVTADTFMLMVFAGPNPAAPADDTDFAAAIIDCLVSGDEALGLTLIHTLPELELRGFLPREASVAFILARAACLANSRELSSRASLLANVTFHTAALTSCPSALDLLRSEAAALYDAAAPEWQKKVHYLHARASACSAAKLRCITGRIH